MNDVLIVGAARLPIGRFGGALKEVSNIMAAGGMESMSRAAYILPEVR